MPWPSRVFPAARSAGPILHTTAGLQGCLAIIVLMLLVSGCYHVRVTAPDPNPATEYQQRTIHVLFWGLVQQDTRAINCQSNALDEVDVTTNLGYLVLSVATLGIWVPMQVRWRCAKEPLQEGDPLGLGERPAVPGSNFDPVKNL